MLCGFHWHEEGKRNTLCPACVLFLESSRLSTFPAATDGPDTHVCVHCGQNMGADCAEPDSFVAVQTDKQAEPL